MMVVLKNSILPLICLLKIWIINLTL
jgi:hypothetical protein